MSSWQGNDVYNNPEAFNTQIVGSFELDNESYQFDTILVLKDMDSGKFYVLHDAGCSCPEPFDMFTTKESLGRLFSVHEAIVEVNSYCHVSANGYVPNPHEVISRILNQGALVTMTEKEFLESLEENE